jgi:hypothetical protein
MKLSRLLLWGAAALGLATSPAPAAPLAITFSSIGIFHDPGPGAGVPDLDLALFPDLVAFLPFHTNLDLPGGDGDSFTQAAGQTAATFAPNFFGLTMAPGTGINQFDRDNDFGGPSTLTITFTVDYLFDAFGFGPWFEFAIIPLRSFAGAGDKVEFHLDATFTDVTGAPVVLGPGLDIDFIHDGDVTPGFRTTVLKDQSGLLAAIAGGSTVRIAGSIVFSADDPQQFVEIFTIEPLGLNVPVPEPATFALVLVALVGLGLAHGARRFGASVR